MRRRGVVPDLYSLWPIGETFVAYAATLRTRGETQSFSPLANHPISYGWEQAHRYVPKELRHLLPQIRARCARKGRDAKVPAAQLPKSNKNGSCHPTS